MTSERLTTIHVRPRAGQKARGWLTAGPFRIPCALGPAGLVRIKREGDGGTPVGRFRLLWGYYRPDRKRPPAGGVPLKPMRRDQGWCEDPKSPRYNRPVRLPAPDVTDRMWRADRLYDLTFVLDQNFTARAKAHRQRNLLPPRPRGPHADRRLRRHQPARHAQARAAPGAWRDDDDWVMAIRCFPVACDLGAGQSEPPPSRFERTSGANPLRRARVSAPQRALPGL